MLIWDESAYWDEVERLCVWCGENNQVLNTSKTKELVVDNIVKLDLILNI